MDITVEECLRDGPGRWIGSAGVGIAYDWTPAVSGCAEGSPVCLVHGLNSNRRVWTRQVGPLSSRHAVLTIDLRGHGDSDSPPSGYRVADYAADISELLLALKIPPLHLLGTSVGGMVAQVVAANSPDQFVSLVLVGTAGEPAPIDGDAIAEIVEQVGPGDALEPFVATNTFAPGSDPALAEEIMAVIRSEPAWRSAQRWREIAMEQDSFPFAAITTPSLILHGDRDLTVPIDQAFSLWRAMQDSRLAVLPGCGHMPFLEYPSLFNTLILNFFEKTERGVNRRPRGGQ